MYPDTSVLRPVLEFYYSQGTVLVGGGIMRLPHRKVLQRRYKSMLICISDLLLFIAQYVYDLQHFSLQKQTIMMS